ncbi:MAG: UvrD-helicase domain-containing protein [Gammaproteobacteria bacterium]
MKDDLIRREALDPYQSFIVQAPAGSGKTQLLTSRILSLLASRVQKPESILAITFTRKAAQEMKRRVMKALMLGKGPEPEKEHEKALWALANAVLAVDEKYQWRLLENPQRLRIMTIDALCSSITHQLPLSSRLGADPKPIESSRSTYIKAAQQAIHLLLEQENSALETLLLHLNNNQEKASEWIANMLSSREQWLPLLYAQDRDDLTKLRRTLESNIAIVIQETFEKTMEKTWGVDWDGLSLYVSFAASNLESAYAQEVMASWVGLSPDISDFDKWRALCRWICTKEGDLRKTVDKRQGFPASSSIKDKEEAAHAKQMKEGFMAWLNHVREDVDACDALRELISLPDPIYSDRQWEVLKALFHVLPVAVEQLHLLFASRSEVDFTAIARCALTALGGDGDPTDLDLKLDDTLHHILVDEFQDTSKPQFELIHRLVAFWENDGQKTLFLVGDPMQSIYRFRQAEVGGFLQAQLYGMGPIPLKSVSLSSNFRSERPVIDWINEQMPPAFAPEDDIYMGAITYAPFEAQHDASPGAGVYVERIAEEATEGPAFLSTLTRLLQDKTIETIAILVRNRNHIEDILPTLRAAKIPYQAVDMEKIIETPCVRQLFQLTQAYLNVANSQAWISVLMSPYCGMTLSDLTHLKNSASTYWEALLTWNTIDAISADGKWILSRVAPILTAWMANKNRLPMAQAIEGVWLALGGPASLPTLEGVADAEPYFDLLSECEQGGTLDIEQFNVRLDKLFSKASGAANIQIMTIHHAKGLEFDAVLIPGLERQPKSSEKPLLLWESCPIDSGHVFLFAPIHPTQEDVDPIYEYIWKKNKIREKNENARLLYVALTRAKKQLYLFAKEVKSRPNSFIALIENAVAEQASPTSQPNESSAPCNAEMIPLSYVLKRLNPTWDNPYFSRDTAMALVSDDKANPIDMNAILPSQFEHKTLGTLIHKELYLWSLDHGLISQSIENHLPRWRAMLLEYGLPEVHLDWVKTVMARVQADPTAQDILSPHLDARSEYDITVQEDGKVKTYVIDRTYVDKDGVRVIVDYKTAEHAEGFEKHRAQLEGYARVMRTLEDRPIRLCLYYPLTGDIIVNKL